MQIEKWLKGNDIWALALLKSVSETSHSSTDTGLQTVLEEFKDIFSIPSQLPIPRPFDNHIPLVPGSILVNSRPYKYSPIPKNIN
jgi:hypothetical protein